jgi:aminoglycoside phosphotransferase (APT) family kinase protein
VAASQVTDRATAHADALGLDLEATQGWMASLGIEPTGRVDFTRIGLGQSNLTIAVHDEGGGRWILRRPPLGELLASAHDVVREARILAALGESSVAVPRVLGLCEDVAVSSAPLLLMEHVEGLVVDEMPKAEALGVGMRRALSESLVDTLASVHAVDLEATGLTGLASHGHYGQRQLRRWSAQWEDAKTRELPALEELTATLRGILPEQHGTVLVHGDFHMRNLICSPRTGRVRAVLDWELATLGDPLADLGTLLAYWPEADDPSTPLFQASVLPGFGSRDELAARYLDRTGRDGSSVTFWHALGLWKVAIICEGVVRRGLNDPLNIAGDALMDATVVDRLVERALRTLAAAGV